MPAVGDEEAVARANAAFYEAFEARDLDAMADRWERTERATCTHPGWSTLHGWPRVAASWDAIFRNTSGIQFLLTETRVHVAGDVAWVTLNENILQGGTPDGLHASTVAALNVFVRRGADWVVVAHHGSPVAEP